MRLVSPLLKHVVYPSLSRSGYLRRCASSGPAVVTYHGVLPQGYQARDIALDGHLVTAVAFLQQIHLLKKNYNIISPDQFLGWCDGRIDLPRRSVLLTCDDGLLNTFTDMLPLIQETEVPFIFFVTGASAEQVSSMLWYEGLYLWLHLADPANLVGFPGSSAGNVNNKQVLWRQLIKQMSALDWPARKQALQELRTRIGISSDWESEYSQNEALRRRFFMLNAAELREVQNAGVTIGAHTVSHAMLSQMNDECAFEEMANNRARLEETLSTTVWALAFPFGNAAAVGAREPELARRAGFKCAFMNVEDTSRQHRFVLPRIHVSLRTTVAEFDAHLSGLHQSIRGKFVGAAVPA